MLNTGIYTATINYITDIVHIVGCVCGYVVSLNEMSDIISFMSIWAEAAFPLYLENGCLGPQEGNPNELVESLVVEKH
jgi:hypothetical protein